MFKNKTLMITGGTGSFGNAVLNRFLETDVAEIRIFSRDEKKQEDMRLKFQSSKLKFYLGDVRDHPSLDVAMNGVDFVFHAAALKQVPSCDFYPMEAVKTNILGTENLIDGAIKNGVSKEELRAIIHVIGIYCGVPQALECMRAARKVLDEQK